MCATKLKLIGTFRETIDNICTVKYEVKYDNICITTLRLPRTNPSISYLSIKIKEYTAQKVHAER